MQSLFRKWALLFLGTAFLLAFGLSYALQTDRSIDTAKDRLFDTLQHIENRLTLTKAKSAVVRADANKEFVDVLKNIATSVKNSPEILRDKKLFAEFVTQNGLQQLNVADKKGVIVASYPYDLTGTDMKKSAETARFMGLVKDVGMTYVDPLPETAADIPEDNRLIQSAGVSRTDEAGIVHGTRSLPTYVKALRDTDIHTIMSLYSVGKTGHILAAENGKIIGTAKGSEHLSEKTLKNLGLGKSFFDNSGFFKAKLDGKSTFFAFKKVGKLLLIATLSESEVFAQNRTFFIANAIGYLCISILLFVLMTVFLKKNVISPLNSVCDTLKTVNSNTEPQRITVTTPPEFAALSAGINTMIDELKHVNAEEKERMSWELQLAHEIQSAFLPKKFPPYPQHTEFDVFAALKPAKGVSGDFYDFYLSEPAHDVLYFVIADVSGKGIPASLFMMSAKALIKKHAEAGNRIADIFKKVNQELLDANNKGMFVTAFMGTLDLSTGVLHYVNAGHNPPFITDKEGRYTQLPVETGCVLGIVKDAKYKESTITLKMGDTIFMYTDGVTEAENKTKAVYTVERLKAVLQNNRHASPEKLIGAVKTDVATFCEGAEPSDDMTMLAVTYQGKEITVPAITDKQEQVMNFVDEILCANNVSERTRAETGIVIDEILTNIARYAYAPDIGNVTVFCSVNDGTRLLTLRFADSGKPFNPLNIPDTDVTLPLEHRADGKLGLLLVTKMVDSMMYDYKDGQNILTVQKKLI